ncbi:MAG: geranylgeranylglyceryl/heptaprenylglyceryl phosphate synthase [Candidatus Bathyarchaeota archaeon]|nr:geranylgeranylglyceryl/heptaprenylglyceryl phosphate synthase [Candidatus Bathyarchaeota archaeon]
MHGQVEKYLLEKIKADGAIHITLIDPENATPSQAAAIAQSSASSGTSAIMIGGSTSDSEEHLDNVIKAIKGVVDLPTILFPSNINGISQYADAIWFMSLLNSEAQFFLMGAQIAGAPLVKKFNIEPISMGYIIVGDGGTAGKVGKAIKIPFDKPELVVAHALAGQFLGMRFIYLEGGSGVVAPVPPEMIRAVKQAIDVPLIVGGGIRTHEQAALAVSAGADIIVTGNVVEKTDGTQRVTEIIKGIQVAKR